MAESKADKDPRAERRVRRLTREIHAFGRAHGGAEAQIAYLGERGARIVLVGEDGAWGDLVAPTHELARRAVEASGLSVHEAFDGELAAKVRTGPYEWTRMAGIQIGGRASA
ncbi:hypothetical protein RVR_2024 [Actinacidiphila reveromycinica]|uniref:Uncharacterized protein n=1 Tax=Actinacidiphila reveromycinica TaxID=659352 RepID=A0A7U3VMH4_9ACTN|nr:hypothetical protein [Streptomyces sp. SN-593]BBA96635.1 hypothetical protein RVR_2024 [Streptomyces sp. SN-593]